MPDSTPLGLNLAPESLHRLRQTVIANDRRPSLVTPPPAGGDGIGRCKYMIVKEALTARSGMTLGFGRAAFLAIVYDESSQAFNLVESDAVVIVLNGAPSSIGVGRVIQVKIIDNYLNVDVDYCP